MVATAVMSHQPPAMQIASNAARSNQADLEVPHCCNASQRLSKQKANKDAYLCYADCQDDLTLMVQLDGCTQVVFDNVRPDLTKSGWDWSSSQTVMLI